MSAWRAAFRGARGSSAGDAAGAYAATSFTLNQGGPEEDLLAQGSSITLTLLADGTTTGHMFVPAALTGESDFDEDLDGTWTQADDVVRLEHTADTFLRDIDLVVSGINQGANVGNVSHHSGTVGAAFHVEHSKCAGIPQELISARSDFVRASSNSSELSGTTTTWRY